MFLYHSATLLISILALPFFLLRSKTRPNLADRYGLSPLPPGQYIWFHGASIGEIKGLLPLINIAREKKSLDQKILVTAFSYRGLLAAAGSADYLRLAPLDSALFIRLLIRKAKIKRYVFGETEIWPGLLSILKQRSVPINLVNGRISDQTLGLIKFLGFWFRPAISKIDQAFVLTETDKQRLNSAGVKAATVIRNLKHATAQRHAPTSQFKFQSSRPTLLISCIHRAEADILTNLPLSDYNLIIAPRQEHDFEFFAAQLNQCSQRVSRVSQLPPAPEQLITTHSLLVDSFGILDSCYCCADFVILGGSFVSGIGGHNPIEAIRHGLPVITGQFTANQTSEIDLLFKQKAIIIAQSIGQLSLLISDQELVARTRANAIAFSKDFTADARDVFEQLA